MRRWGTAAAVLVCVVLLWWLWPAADAPSGESAPSRSPTSANEGALPEVIKPSSWNAPIEQRGEKKLSGVVLRDGQPVAGAVVTAVAAHGEEILSDLPCKCDNHCGQKLLACGCAEASGQLVELVGQRTGEGVPLARATSGADGAFTLSGLEQTTVTLYADASDSVGWLANVASDTADAKVVVNAGRTIRGKVVTGDAQPAKGALVTAIFSEHSRFFDAVADEQGAFSLGPLPAGKYAVVAMQAGLLPDHQQVGEDDLDSLTLELSAPRSLSGVVLAADVPLPGVVVKLEGQHRKRTVTTDAKGEFRLERLRPGSYELFTETTKGVGSVTALVGKLQDRSGVTITVGQGEPLEGRVVMESGAPVPDAKVSISVGERWRTTTSNGSGEFRFEGVTTETTQVYAQKRGLLDARVVSRGGQKLELRMSPAAILSGVVHGPGGASVPKFTAAASALDGGTDMDHLRSEISVDGGFSLEVFPGEYVLRISAPPFASKSVNVVAPSADVVVVLELGATISGRVLDFDGAPAAGVNVSARKERLKPEATTKTDAEGRFKLEGLGAGTFLVEAAMRDKFMPVWRASAQVTLAAQGAAEITLRPKPGVAFAGVVLSAEGEPVEGVSVMAWERGATDIDAEAGVGSAVTDAQGRFRIRTLKAGAVNVTARHEKQHLEAFVKATAPDEHLILKLKGSTTVSGRVVDSSGNPVTSFKMLHTEVEAPDGTFKTPIELTEAQIAIDAPGYAQLMRKVTLVPGDNPLGDLVLQRGRPVTGLVRDAVTKAPIPNALVDVGLERSDLNFYLAEKLGAVRTDAQGRYRLAAVDSSSTHIFAAAPGHGRAMQRIVGNTADFDLRRAGSLTVSLVGADGAPVSRAHVRTTGPSNEQGFLLPNFESPGQFQSNDLTPGEWTLSVLSGDGRTFRSQKVTVGDAPVEIVLKEATDGVTVEVKIIGDAESVLLAPGLVTDAAQLGRAGGEFVPLMNGSARNVLPGQWTVVLWRGDETEGEASFHPIEVKASGNPVWTLTPQWQVVPRTRP